MKNKKQKGFTIVELVIVIAVIAILAAVLIPTFGNLINKADETVALSDARNYTAQLLPEIVEKVNEVGDLLVIQQKGDSFYVHAYLVDQGKTVSYKQNPVPIKKIETYYNENYYYYDLFEDKCNSSADTLGFIAECLVDYLDKSLGVIYQSNDSEKGAGEWWTDSKLKELSAELNFDTKKTRIRADYKVIREAFEQSSVGDDHKCTAETLTLYAAQEPTCTKYGHEAYYACQCGKLYGTDTDLQNNKLDKIDLENPTGHNYNYISDGAAGHHKICQKCSAKSGTEEHTAAFIEGDNTYYNGCEHCTYKTEIDLENDINIAATFKLAMKLNLCLKNDAENTSDDNVHVKDGKHPTMYDAFCAIRDDKSSFSYNNITAVIDDINSAEESDNNGYTIVWDQIIDRFAVVKEESTNSSKSYFLLFVPYTQEYWADQLIDSATNLLGSSYVFPFWDTFKNITKGSNNGQIDIYFSIYLSGENNKLENDNFPLINVGFDIGERDFLSYDTESSSYFDPLGFNLIGKNGINIIFEKSAYIIRTTNDTKISIGANNSFSSTKIYHYGSLKGLVFNLTTNYGSEYLTYHEFGTINAKSSETESVGDLNGVTCKGENTKKYYTLIAEKGSKFAETEEYLEKLNINFNDNGGQFGQTFTAE